MQGLPPLPPFPEGLPEAHLETISLSKLNDNGSDESKRLFEVLRTRGMFYLDVKGYDTIEKVQQAFKLGEEYFRLPLEEKMKTECSLRNGNIGYKPFGALKYPAGKRDLAEFCALSADALKSDSRSTEIPKLFSDHQDFLASLVQQLHRIARVILEQSALQLGLVPHTFTELQSGPTSSVLRIMHNAPRSPEQENFFAHTDSGSVTVLFNQLGGLQILPSADACERKNAGAPEDAWHWVRPRADCAVVNLGDTMVQWSGGLLRAPFHRVLYAPGRQAAFDRYSLGYFLKPGDGAPTVPVRDMLAASSTEYVANQCEYAKMRQVKMEGIFGRDCMA